MLGFGGTFSIESPAPYSAVARGLIEELGIDVPSYPKYLSRDLYRSFGLGPKIFFDKETFGADKLVTNPTPRVGGESEDDKVRAHAVEMFLQEAPFFGIREGRLQASGYGKDRLPARLEFGRKESPPGPHELQQFSG